ncbi:hypothetical protein BT96DRAFT_995173 [Gymnopus androsaceus JB14]|uniref:Thioredoxin domain-containing protein n=1 Tax=Gymnopus androsaceus JB14 TaxID=1447944 RepID=A0A6A4HM51_9AGAR|nr:hypothetical protein BT96DRAFT_995173 [Gymnopus androsaceus JB14]
MIASQSNHTAASAYDLANAPYLSPPAISATTFGSEYVDWNENPTPLASSSKFHNAAARASSPTLPKYIAQREPPVKPWQRALNMIHRNLNVEDIEIESDSEHLTSSDAFWEELGADSQPQTPHITPLTPTLPSPLPFSINGLPTRAETNLAADLPILDEEGYSIPFRTILYDFEGGQVKTIVCFIRHFLCPICQDYMYSIARNVDPNALKKAGLRLVIIGNGGWEMIKSYRRIFKLPYPVYTDPTAALYTALGMTLRTLDPGPKPPRSSGQRPESYVRHRSIASGVALVLRNAVKARMPVWRYMGDKTILGGEFVFQVNNSVVECEWAHRMQYTTAHEEIRSVLGEAGGRSPEIETEVFSGMDCRYSICSSLASPSPNHIQSEIMESSNLYPPPYPRHPPPIHCG